MFFEKIGSRIVRHLFRRSAGERSVMAHWKPVDLVQDLVNQIGGEERIKRFQSGELVLVERSAQTAVASGDNGSISPYVGLNTEAFITDWREFYRQVHNMKMNPLFKRLPPVTPGFNWGVWVPKGMMPQRAYEMGAAMYPSWKWTGEQSLDEVIDFAKEVRTASTRQYVVWCEDSVEPSSKLANLSALQVVERKVNTLTLIEVELLHQWFFWKFGGKHLDIRNVTRCDGSRYSDGFVPSVHWNGYYGGVCVNWYDPDNASDDLRSREAVS